MRGPVFYNQTGVSPRLTLEQMQELRIAVTIPPGAILRLTVQAVHDFAVALKQRGPAAEAEFSEKFRGHPLGDLHTFAGFDRIREWEEAVPAARGAGEVRGLGRSPAVATIAKPPELSPGAAPGRGARPCGRRRGRPRCR